MDQFINNATTGSTQPAAELSDRSQYRDQMVSEAGKDRNLQRELQTQRIGAQTGMQSQEIAQRQQEVAAQQQLAQQEMAQRAQMEQQRMAFEKNMYELEDAGRREQQAIALQLQAAQMKGDANESRRLQALSMEKALATRFFQQAQMEETNALMGFEAQGEQIINNMGQLVEKENILQRQLSDTVMAVNSEFQSRLFDATTPQSWGQMLTTFSNRIWEEAAGVLGLGEYAATDEGAAARRAELESYADTGFLNMIAYTGMLRDRMSSALVQYVPDKSPETAAAASVALTDVFRQLAREPGKFSPAQAEALKPKLEEIQQKYGLTVDTVYNYINSVASGWSSALGEGQQGSTGSRGKLMRELGRDMTSALTNFHMVVPDIHMKRLSAFNPATAKLFVNEIRDQIAAGGTVSLDEIKRKAGDNKFVQDQIDLLWKAVEGTFRRTGSARQKMDTAGLDLVRLMGGAYGIQAENLEGQVGAVEDVVSRLMRETLEEEANRRRQQTSNRMQRYVR